MDKELKFVTQSAPRQTDPAMKKRKKSEAQIQQWEKLRRQSTIVEDKELNIDGMVRLTLSQETQKSLGCLIGTHVSSESPWVNVKKEIVMNHLAGERGFSELYTYKDIMTAYKEKAFLFGYIFTAEKPCQFYICLTANAKKEALELIESNKQELERRVLSCIHRDVKTWYPLGSGQEVDDNKPHCVRPLFVIETVAPTRGLNEPEEFQKRDPDDIRDGYVSFEPMKHKYTTVIRKRVDVAIQASPEMDISIAQTIPPLPSNKWTQYEYHVDIKDVISEELAGHMKQFVQDSFPQMTDLVRYSGVFDLYKDDYPNLVKSTRDIEIPRRVIYKPLQLFMDVKSCKGKIISAVSWHPTWTGMLVCAYVDKPEIDDDAEVQRDDVLHDVFSTNPVLVWSFADSLNPRLILNTSREVYALQFCPFNPNILIGGCANGQVAVWDLSSKLKKSEQKVKLSEKTLMYRLALHSIMGWNKANVGTKYINPVLVSTLEYSSSGSIMEIRWLSPYYKLSRLGKYQELKEDGKKALQFMTCSTDGSLCIWDLQSRTRVKFGRRKPKQKIKFPILKPLYKLVAESVGGGGRIPLVALAFQPFPLSYVPLQHVDPGRKLSITQRLTFKPEFQKPKGFPRRKVYLGTAEGELIQSTWDGLEYNSGEAVNSETLKYTRWNELHDGPVSSVSISPFNTDLILTVGGKLIAIWRESIKECPIFWRCSKVRLTDGVWSPFRPSMFYITKTDGAFEVWDFLAQSDKPIMIQNVTGNALTGIYPTKLGEFQKFLAVGDSSGILHVFFMPEEHISKDPKSQKTAFTAFFNRELECRAFVKERQDRWLGLNAEFLNAQKEAAETKAKQEEVEKRAKERADWLKKKKREEELEKKTSQKKENYLKEEDAKKQWHSDQEKYLIEVLMHKKKLNEDELIQKKLPLDNLKEDEERKRAKQRRQPFLDITWNSIPGERHITVNEIAAKLAAGHSEVQEMIHSLGYRKVCARWVPCLLTEDHKHQRCTIAQNLLQIFQNEGDEFLTSIVTGDESWFHHYEPEIKRQNNILQAVHQRLRTAGMEFYRKGIFKLAERWETCVQKKMETMWKSETKEPPKPVEQVEMKYEDVDEIVTKHFLEFKQKEELALKYKTANAYDYVVNWKELVAEGLERRQIINNALHSDTKRSDRYLRAKAERKEAMKAKAKAKEREMKHESSKISPSKSGESRHKRRAQTARKSGKKSEPEVTINLSHS